MDGGCYTYEQIGAAMILAGFPKNPTVIGSGIATVRPESGGCRVDNGICCWGPWQHNRADGGGSARESCAADLMCSTQLALTKWKRGNCFACLSGPNPWQAGTDSGGSSSDQALAKKLLAMDSTQLTSIVQGAGSSGGDSDGDGIIDTALDALGTGAGGPIGVAANAIGDLAGGVDSPFSGIAAAIGQMVELLKKVFEALFSPTFWLRVGKGLLGAVAVVAGAAILASAALGDSNPARALGKSPAAKVARQASRERSKDRAYDRETDRQLEREAAKQKARTDAKNDAEESGRRRFFDTVNKDEVPF